MHLFLTYTRQQKEEEKIFNNLTNRSRTIPFGQNQLHKDKDDRWPHKNKNKNSIGGSEKEMANFHQRYTTNITLASLRSKSCQK